VNKYIDKQWVDEVWQKLEHKLSVTAEKSKNKIPYTTKNGVHDDRTADVSWWTNGFWAALMGLMYDLAASKREFDRMAQAWQAVKETGYGLVTPTMEEMQLEEPEMVHTGGRFGVRLKASAPSYHLIRVDLDTELSPIVGTEKQSRELADHLLEGFGEERAGIWDTQMFGKPLSEMVRESLAHKLVNMPENAQQRTRAALSRVINDGKENLFFFAF